MGALFDVDARDFIQKQLATYPPLLDALQRLTNVFMKGADGLLGYVSAITRFTGDPHIFSFDSCRFDFQGTGDYVAATSLDGSFAMHVRLQKAAMFPGATLLVAMAIRAGVAIPVVVIESTLLSGGIVPCLVVRVNGQKLDFYSSTAPPYSSTATVQWSAPGIQIGMFGNAHVVVEFSNGLRLDVKDSVQWGLIPTPFMLLPASLSGQVRGLLGNSNGDPSDDFAMGPGGVEPAPDGMSCANQSASSLWTWGHSWRITASTPKAELLLNYPNGSTPDDFFDNAWRPASSEDVMRAAGTSMKQAAAASCSKLADSGLRSDCELDYIISSGSSAQVQASQYAELEGSEAVYASLVAARVTVLNDTLCLVNWTSSSVPAASLSFRVEVWTSDEAWSVAIASTTATVAFVPLDLPEQRWRQSRRVRITAFGPAVASPGASATIAFETGSCTRICANNFCGPNGCGGTCGCASGLVCNNSACSQPNGPGSSRSITPAWLYVVIPLAAIALLAVAAFTVRRMRRNRADAAASVFRL